MIHITASDTNNPPYTKNCPLGFNANAASDTTVTVKID